MTVVLWTAVAVVFLLVAFVVHEIFHVVAIRELGLKIERFQIGVYKPRLTFRLKRFPFPISISPILLGAYVKMEHEDAHRLQYMPYRNQAWVAGAGVVGNMILACVLYALHAGVNLITNSSRFSFTVTVMSGLLALLLAWVTWHFRRGICAYVVLPFGLLVLASTAYFAVLEPTTAVGGPSAVGTLLVANNLEIALLIGTVMSLNLVLINSLPALGLDGGRLALALSWKWWGGFGERITGYAAGGLTLVLIGLVITGEVYRWVV